MTRTDTWRRPAVETAAGATALRPGGCVLPGGRGARHACADRAGRSVSLHATASRTPGSAPETVLLLSREVRGESGPRALDQDERPRSPASPGPSTGAPPVDRQPPDLPARDHHPAGPEDARELVATGLADWERLWESRTRRRCCTSPAAILRARGDDNRCAPSKCAAAISGSVPTQLLVQKLEARKVSPRADLIRRGSEGPQRANAPDQLVDALIKSRKPFDLMLYPGKTHGIRGEDATIHLWTMVYDYLERHLK